MKRIVAVLLCALGMLTLILDSVTAIKGASEGVWLCLVTLVPTLLPYLFFSQLLVGAMSGLNMKGTAWICRFLRIPEGCLSVFLIGLLGGYPVGAHTLATLRKSNALSANDGCRMLAFCNNCGPAFLFGIISRSFPALWMIWLLWGIHIISAVMTAFLFSGSPQPYVTNFSSKCNATTAMKNALTAMALICGWVILFRMMIYFLQRWFGHLLSVNMLVIFSGLMELSNGCLMLNQIEDIGTRFIVCCGIIAFGGLCVIMQTLAVIDKHIDPKAYIPGKISQTGFSLALAGIIAMLLQNRSAGLLAIGIGTLLVTAVYIFLRISAKRGSNLHLVSV